MALRRQPQPIADILLQRDESLQRRGPALERKDQLCPGFTPVVIDHRCVWIVVELDRCHHGCRDVSVRPTNRRHPRTSVMRESRNDTRYALASLRLRSGVRYAHQIARLRRIWTVAIIPMRICSGEVTDR